MFTAGILPSLVWIKLLKLWIQRKPQVLTSLVLFKTCFLLIFSFFICLIIFVSLLDDKKLSNDGNNGNSSIERLVCSTCFTSQGHLYSMLLHLFFVKRFGLPFYVKLFVIYMLLTSTEVEELFKI